MVSIRLCSQHALGQRWVGGGHAGEGLSSTVHWVCVESPSMEYGGPFILFHSQGDGLAERSGCMAEFLLPNVRKALTRPGLMLRASQGPSPSGSFLCPVPHTDPQAKQLCEHPHLTQFPAFPQMTSWPALDSPPTPVWSLFSSAKPRRARLKHRGGTVRFCAPAPSFLQAALLEDPVQ